MRVLVAIDGSAPAGRAVDLVHNIRWPAGTRIVVAEAVETGPGLFGGPWPTLAVLERTDLEEAIRKKAAADVAEAARCVAAPGVNAESTVLRGRPATAIIEAARAIGADLIVVGSRGHGTIETMVLGSVSSEVIDHAPTPVLVARTDRLERIVFGWDGSAAAKSVALLLRTWPMFATSKVRVLSVADVEVPWWTGFPGSAELGSIYADAAATARHHHKELASEMAADLVADGIGATAESPLGDAATEILSAAASDTDLIALGTHGRTGLSRLLLGSVARNVVQHARCSVLVSPAGGGRA